ncbi:hypothetical protein J4401_02460 [Candidatus Woesearchaeota archaeon]|nr:hypothetical protein [Candidatus Woesearchaeota archaeon]
MDKRLLAKGKRGIAYLAEYNKEKIVIKEKNPKSETHRIDIEAQFLPKLNKKGIGPKFIFFENSSLGMEYVEGELLEKHILHAERGEIMRILAEIVKQLYDMDMMGIGKEEMQNPYKHIIIRNGKPVMIDFERCHHTQKPKNITQFLQYISNGRMQRILMARGIILEKEKLILLSKEYKEKMEIMPVLKFLKSL